ncbi:hypothetical protein NE634_15510 [Lacrimispora saccharolytica]|nr:hypothetical protein [Lacrimispora saccharolytica]
MNGERVKLVYTITKEAFNLIQQGKAELQSGGVRKPDGSLLELAVPGKQTIENGVSKITLPDGAFSGINMVSSLANNVQSAYIQKGVNQANRKLDDLLRMQTSVMNELHMIGGLQIANLALGFVNLAVSIKNFSDIKKQLNEVKGVLDSLSEHMQKKEIYDCVEEYEKKYSFMINCIENMTYIARSDSSDKITYSNTLSEVGAFLKKIICQFNNRDIDSELGCAIIMGLVPCYVQAVKIYSAEHYYAEGKTPEPYKQCMDVLDSINSDTFRDTMKRYLLTSRPELSMNDTYKSFSGIMTSIKSSINNFQFEKEIWEALPQKDYQNLDNIIQNNILNNKSIEFDEERVFITVSEKNRERMFIPITKNEERKRTTITEEAVKSLFMTTQTKSDV